MTASPYDLHLIVVNGAIRYAKHAEQALQGRSYEIAHLALAKSREFLGEMLAGLRSEHAPDVVANLKNLFVYVHANLVRADVSHDPQLVRDAVQILESHRETWIELGSRIAAHEKPAGETPRKDLPGAVPAPHTASTMRLSRTV